MHDVGNGITGIGEESEKCQGISQCLEIGHPARKSEHLGTLEQDFTDDSKTLKS